jgi:aryl-alcohol dehydrogenase-like predicted oxidoreductase
MEKLGKLSALCDRYDHTVLQLAMGWLVARPCVSTVIAGVTSVKQLEQNVAAAQWRGSAEELAAIDKICPPPESGFPGPRR